MYEKNTQMTRRGANGPSSAAPLNPPRWAVLALVVGAVLLFSTLKLYSFNVTPGDEHLYFNMALLVNEGLVPHRDFFYTHPPLQLYTAALVFHLFGYSLFLGKLLPNLAMLIGGLLVFAVGRRALGAGVGSLACAIFLLSFDPLRISSHFTGGNLSFTLAMIGLWLAYRDQPWAAGIAFGLGALVAVYVLPGAGAVALMLWGRSRGRMLRFIAATAIVAVAGNLILYALAGWEYIYQVYLTQFLKGPEGSLIGYTLYHRLGSIFYENRLLTAGFVPGVLLVAWEVRDRLRTQQPGWAIRDVVSGRFRPWENQRCEALIVLAAWFVLFWLLYLSLRKHHAYYFVLVMPVFAWFSAHAYLEVGRAILAIGGSAATSVTRASRRSGRPHRAVARSRERAGRLVPAILTVFLILGSVSLVDALYVPYSFRRYGTRVLYYRWQPNSLLPQLDHVVRAALWQSSYDPRHPPSGITRYLHHESRHITKHNQLYAAVLEHSDPSDSIFGEAGLVPLIASETGRHVAANLVDISDYRLIFGLSHLEDWIAAIEEDKVRVLVVREGRNLMRYRAFREYARERFETVAQVHEPLFGIFEVLRRREP